MTGGDARSHPRVPSKCPICRRPQEELWRPFCSKRCADIDLGRWRGEVYRIPAVEEDLAEDPFPESADDDGDRG
jgi:hypothetical protein